MAEHPLALYFPNSQALIEGVTSLPTQLGSSGDLYTAHIYFTAVEGDGKPSILSRERAEYSFNRAEGEFQVSKVELVGPPHIEIPDRSRLSRDLLSGGRPQTVLVSLERDYRSFNNNPNFNKGGKELIRHFNRLMLPELIAKGYVATHAELNSPNSPHWQIDGVVMQLEGGKALWQEPVFTMAVAEKDSRNWLRRVFEEAKDHPFYDRSYQLAVMVD